MKVKGLLVLLVAICCLKAVAQDGIRRLALREDMVSSYENIMAGDVNDDGKIDMVDVTLTIRYLTETPSGTFQEQAADVNMDGLVTSADVPLIVNIILGGGCPDSHHPHAIDLGLPSHTKWACCNVGTSVPEGYGNFYGWGERYPNSLNLYNWDTYTLGDYKDDKNYNRLDNLGSDIAGTDHDTALKAWGAPWRMPSLEQCIELIENTTSDWVAVNGVYGRRFTGRNGGVVFIPAAGDWWYREHCFAGEAGLYWLSKLKDDEPCYAYHFSFSSRNVYADDYFPRSGGRPIRPVCQ